MLTCILSWNESNMSFMIYVELLYCHDIQFLYVYVYVFDVNEGYVNFYIGDVKVMLECG